MKKDILEIFTEKDKNGVSPKKVIEFETIVKKINMEKIWKFEKLKKLLIKIMVLFKLNIKK